MQSDAGIAEQDFLQAALGFLEKYHPQRPDLIFGDHTAMVAGDARERKLMAQARDWQRIKSEHGWAGVTWPREYGGRGGTAREGALFRELEQGFVSHLFSLFLGVDAIGSLILVHGTDEQRSGYVPSMLRGETVWSAFLSEPDAGSDLAAVRTRAVRDDEGWLVNGQKVWSSRAHLADFGILLARTNVNVPKNDGLTCFIVQLKNPGVTVRPIRQMNGASLFNEVIFTNCRLEEGAVLGVVDRGWNVLMTQLEVERNYIGLLATDSLIFADLVSLATRADKIGDPVFRQRLARVFSSQSILGYLGNSMRVAARAGQDPGSAGATLKLLSAQNRIRVSELALDMLGANGLLLQGGGAEQWLHEFLGSPSVRIAGGTDEVQRNAIGERILGLPREPRVDKGIPFRLL